MPYKDIIICVYKITSPTGRVYVGQTNHYKKRMEAYNNLRCKKQIKLYNSLKKYGVNNHTFEIIVVCETQAELNLMENRYIAIFNALGSDVGLNIKEGGSNGNHSMETKKKISEGRLGSKHHHYGKKLSPEWRLKLSETHKGIIKDDKWRANLSKANIGKKHSEASRLKMSLNKIGKTGRLCRNSKRVLQYSYDGKLINRWDCTIDVTRTMGWNHRNIASVCRGERKTAYGYKWEYA